MFDLSDNKVVAVAEDAKEVIARHKKFFDKEEKNPSYSWEEGCALINDYIDFLNRTLGGHHGNHVGSMSFKGEWFIMVEQVLAARSTLSLFNFEPPQPKT